MLSHLCRVRRKWEKGDYVHKEEGRTKSKEKGRKRQRRIIELMRLNLGRHSSILGHKTVSKMIFIVVTILQYNTSISEGLSLNYHYYCTGGNSTGEEKKHPILRPVSYKLQKIKQSPP